MGYGSWVIRCLTVKTLSFTRVFATLKNHRKVSDLPTSRTSDLPGSSRASPWPPPSHNGAAEVGDRRGFAAGSEYTRSGEENQENEWNMGLKCYWNAAEMLKFDRFFYVFHIVFKMFFRMLGWMAWKRQMSFLMMLHDPSSGSLCLSKP